MNNPLPPFMSKILKKSFGQQAISVFVIHFSEFKFRNPVLEFG
jgi:hypothetical protein